MSKKTPTNIPAETPAALTPGFAQVPGKQEQWNAFMEKLQLDNPPKFTDTISCLAQFLCPVLEAAAKGKTFDMTWKPGGPWS